MIVEGLVFAGALVLTAGMGVPLALATAQAHRWPKPAPCDRSGGRTPPKPVQFTPLDLGPDPVRWPSERPWDLESTLPSPRWPSTEWDDGHFGVHGSKGDGEVHDRGFHAMAGRRGGDGQRIAEEGAPEEAPKAKSRPPKSTKSPVTSDKPRQPKGTRAKATPKPPEAAPAAPIVTKAAGPPDEAEIEHLIATVGLAGTVQSIMSRTGWEFREAAQYLAQRRRS